MTWAEVAGRLASARTYWLGTTMPSGAPHVIAALAAKYTGPADRQYLPDENPDFDVVYAIRPTSAVAWQLADYAGSQRRWSP